MHFDSFLIFWHLVSLIIIQKYFSIEVYYHLNHPYLINKYIFLHLHNHRRNYFSLNKQHDGQHGISLHKLHSSHYFLLVHKYNRNTNVNSRSLSLFFNKYKTLQVFPYISHRIYHPSKTFLT